MKKDNALTNNGSAQLQELDELRKQYAEKWGVSAAAHQQEGDYEWLAADIEGHHTVLEIGCGVGHSTLALLALGHTVTAVEENPYCIEATRERLERNGYSVQVVLRGKTEASEPTRGFTYDTNYADIGTVEHADCLLIEGDALEDEGLVAWLGEREQYDAVLCWLIGTHQYRGHSAVVAQRGIKENWHYRILVQNEVYDLAEVVLRSGGILSVADRLETPSTESLRNELLRSHREQASTTTLQVRDLRYKPYLLDKVKGGMEMITRRQSDGASPDGEIEQSVCVVTSVKP
ncbi:methyltransferase domain-containing protein [Burkholderia cenocepacia]|uniref:methyltransferase domain-containing protein n=1 Tax=Burkholderia cenocepacia TaxID=95486 RepID=UPI002238CF00|nr:methyltransferase domain-containing protein [Burkholderia cenocepacia]MCW5134600.1 methyltransferase domain-containing protein [Burkholderia cenocepacia]